MHSISSKQMTRIMRIVNAVLVALLLVNIAFVFAVQRQAHAAGGDPFGGMSTAVFFCTCTFNLAVTIDDLTIDSSNPQPITLIFQPGFTTLYEFGQIYRPGVWTLGLWQAGGSCEYFSGKDCTAYDVDGTMTMVGTSM